MKIKRISGILIGTSAILVSAVALTSCGGESISFKSYKTESTKEEFEKAYDSFIEEKKTTGYDLTVGNTAERSEKNDENFTNWSKKKILYYKWIEANYGKK